MEPIDESSNRLPILTLMLVWRLSTFRTMQCEAQYARSQKRYLLKALHSRRDSNGWNNSFPQAQYLSVVGMSRDSQVVTLAPNQRSTAFPVTEGLQETQKVSGAPNLAPGCNFCPPLLKWCSSAYQPLSDGTAVVPLLRELECRPDHWFGRCRDYGADPIEAGAEAS